MFPVDFLRLTVDAWRFTLEGFTHRIHYRNPDQPCIFCRDCDTGTVPRLMHYKIRYWNIWMVRILHPKLEAAEAGRRLKKVPICRNEGGYICTPLFLPLVAIISALIWLLIAFVILCETGLIPEEVLRWRDGT